MAQEPSQKNEISSYTFFLNHARVEAEYDDRCPPMSSIIRYGIPGDYHYENIEGPSSDSQFLCLSKETQEYYSTWRNYTLAPSTDSLNSFVAWSRSSNSQINGFDSKLYSNQIYWILQEEEEKSLSPNSHNSSEDSAWSDSIIAIIIFSTLIVGEYATRSSWSNTHPNNPSTITNNHNNYVLINYDGSEHRPRSHDRNEPPTNPQLTSSGRTYVAPSNNSPTNMALTDESPRSSDLYGSSPPQSSDLSSCSKIKIFGEKTSEKNTGEEATLIVGEYATRSSWSNTHPNNPSTITNNHNNYVLINYDGSEHRPRSHDRNEPPTNPQLTSSGRTYVAPSNNSPTNMALTDESPRSSDLYGSSPPQSSDLSSCSMIKVLEEFLCYLEKKSEKNTDEENSISSGEESSSFSDDENSIKELFPIEDISPPNNPKRMKTILREPLHEGLRINIHGHDDPRGEEKLRESFS